MSTIFTRLDSLRKGVWTARDGQQVKLTAMDDNWLLAVTHLISRWRASRASPLVRVAKDEVFAILQAEVERRGLVLYKPQICFCGRKGMYLARGESFCSKHREHAVNKMKLHVRRVDREVWSVVSQRWSDESKRLLRREAQIKGRKKKR